MSNSIDKRVIKGVLEIGLSSAGEKSKDYKEAYEISLNCIYGMLAQGMSGNELLEMLKIYFSEKD